MTKGVIDKVFAKWLRYTNTPQCKQDLLDIQEELKAEIESLKVGKNQEYVRLDKLLGNGEKQ